MKRALLACLVLAAGAADAQQRPSSCVTCHAQLGDEQASIVAEVAAGAHAAGELGCQGCHGGNPDPALAEDMDAAMDPDFAPNPYRGVPSRLELPELCGSCHSDPAIMRRFEPDPRVDQVAEYWTSRHGELLRTGDDKVATCTSCHGVHGILGPAHTDSPVYATRVAETCNRCHGDPVYMAGYDIPVDQYARWRQSVHATGLLEHEDLSAPTCNDCHGNHGALPPGVGSIGYVCGQCHGREAALFRASPKRDGFELHRDLVTEAGSCGDCHGPATPPAQLETTISFTECTTCHGNHGVIRPTVAMLSPLPPTPCAFCHLPQELAAEELPGRAQGIREHFERVRDGLLEEAVVAGLEGIDRFNWMVEQTRELPYHRRGGEGEGDAGLHPEFRRLFEKFRIGTSTYRYRDPVTGEEVTTSVLSCASCHSAEPELASEAVGWQTGVAFVEGMQELTSRTAHAERLLLAAERGGVATAGVRADIHRAVDAQIQLEVLVHTFTAGEGSEFRSALTAGVEAADAAIEGASAALKELAFRRLGLFVSLGLIVLVLIGLALKIRQLGG